MSKLLDFNRTTWKVEIDRVWLMMVPEFAALLNRDKGSIGDYRGQYKLKATDEISYIWLMLDWDSPFRSMDPPDKKREALKVLERLKVTEAEADADTVLQAALKKYQEMLYASSRSLKTLDSIKKSLDQLDAYFDDIDFSKTDNQGKLLHSTKDYISNIKASKEAYASIQEFEEQVHRELEASGGIAGRFRELGIKEKEFAFEKKRRAWSESGENSTSEVTLTAADEEVLRVRSREDDEQDEGPDDDIDDDPEDEVDQEFGDNWQTLN